MSDNRGTTTTALAEVDKRHSRPTGGCTGILFKLFDWNRKFAKKKFFSRKLLPSVRAKQVSNKCLGIDQLPKHRLLADENSGSFPNGKNNGSRGVDSEGKREMQSPGLIARLMGLDSMPAVQKDDYLNDAEKVVSDHKELRPQKLQRTSPLEKRPVSKFGADAFQFKNVLARPSKNHPKLPPPVKSPRTTSGRKASRLIGAASRILEPGLQARGKTRCALTYANAPGHASKGDTPFGRMPTLATEPLDHPSYRIPSKSLNAQPSCKSCGTLVDSMDLRNNMEEQPSPIFGSHAINDFGICLQRAARSKASTSSVHQGCREIFRERKECSGIVFDQESRQACSESDSDFKPLYKSAVHLNLINELRKPQKQLPASTAFRQKTRRANQVPLGENGISPLSKLSNLQQARISLAANAVNGRKKCTLNQCSSSYTGPRIPSKLDSCKLKEGKEFVSTQDGSVSSARKRRSMTDSRQGNPSGFMSSTFAVPRIAVSNAVTGKRMGRNTSLSMNQTCIRNRLTRSEENNQLRINKNDNDDVVSFTFSSPMKHNPKMVAQVESRTLAQKSFVSNENKVIEGFALKGDILGALLEEKLRELTCCDEESATRASSRKITAVILQELLSALAPETSFQKNNVKQKECSQYDGPLSDTKASTVFQAQEKTAVASVNFSNEGDHLSPGSVLEASFSNGSCFSGSLDDCLVTERRTHDDFKDYSWDKPQPVKPDIDLLDSANSLSKGNTRDINYLLSDIRNVLCSLNLADAGLQGSNLAYTEEVILLVELMLGAVQCSYYRKNEFSMRSFLCNELEKIVKIMSWDIGCNVGAEEAKGCRLKGFAFDSVIEYLDNGFVTYSKTGLEAWMRLSLPTNAETLIHEVIRKFRRWKNLAGLIINDLMEMEMSCGLGKWTDFEIEAFELGAEIDGHILQNLIDEVVTDLSV